MQNILNFNFKLIIIIIKYEVCEDSRCFFGFYDFYNYNSTKIDKN